MEQTDVPMEAHCKLEDITEDLLARLMKEFDNMREHPMMEGVACAERLKRDKYSFHYWCPQDKMVILNGFVTNIVNREIEMLEKQRLRARDNNSY